eukprot:scaffold3153_cov243-Pinguiococcus_pyrenoidosus.AAC.1
MSSAETELQNSRDSRTRKPSKTLENAKTRKRSKTRKPENSKTRKPENSKTRKPETIKLRRCTVRLVHLVRTQITASVPATNPDASSVFSPFPMASSQSLRSKFEASSNPKAPIRGIAVPPAMHGPDSRRAPRLFRPYSAHQAGAG